MGNYIVWAYSYVEHTSYLTEMVSISLRDNWYSCLEFPYNEEESMERTRVEFALVVYRFVAVVIV